jgi:hypothetical protein
MVNFLLAFALNDVSIAAVFHEARGQAMDIQHFNYSINWDLAHVWAAKIGAVALILLITWVVAKICKWTFAKLVDRIPLLQREAGGGESVGAALGKIVSLLIWLLGLIAVLQKLGYDNVIKPLQTLVDQMFHYVPNIIGGAVIFFVGTIVAKIASQLVETTLITADADKWAAKAGFGDLSDGNVNNMGLSKVLSTLLYAIIMILFAIAALQALGISSISVPAVNMLQTVFAAIPRFILAGILLGIGFVIGKFVKRLIEQVLPPLGVDNSVASLGIVPEGTSASAIVANLAMTTIMLLIGIQALQALEFGPLSAILTQIVDLGGRVLFGSVIIGAGVMLAQLISKLMASSTGEGGFAPSIVRYAIIALAAAMGLRFMGLANDIVNLAFGLILGAGAVACALAFGLGGRDAAAKLLDRLNK